MMDYVLIKYYSILLIDTRYFTAPMEYELSMIRYSIRYTILYSTFGPSMNQVWLDTVNRYTILYSSYGLCMN